ncbi:MAG: hypothetical protein QOG72_1566 [Sphingomonadales bacterium]|nr:hypothetical protein [Sphingomonadales bacterium]
MRTVIVACFVAIVSAGCLASCDANVRQRNVSANAGSQSSSPQSGLRVKTGEPETKVSSTATAGVPSSPKPQVAQVAPVVQTGPPEGRYALDWKPDRREGVSVRFKARRGGQSEEIAGGRFELEFSVRNGKLNGCLLSDPSQPSLEPEPSVCTYDGKILKIDIGKGTEAGSGMRAILKRSGPDNFSGTLQLRTSMLPGTGIDVGKATLAPL